MVYTVNSNFVKPLSNAGLRGWSVCYLTKMFMSNVCGMCVSNANLFEPIGLNFHQNFCLLAPFSNIADSLEICIV